MLENVLSKNEVLDDVVLVIFTYNQERYLSESLASAINQTRLPSKILILDDASPDNSHEVIQMIIKGAPKSLSIEYWRNEINAGLISQLNKLNGLFENKLLIFQSGDDIAYPNRVECTYKLWLDHNKPPLIVSAYDEINENGQLIKAFNHQSKIQKNYTFDKLINRKASIFGCCPAYNSQVFNHFGHIPPFIFNDDRVNTFRALCLGDIVYNHQPLLKYRVGVGISHLNQSTIVDRVIRLAIEADRELKDIVCHQADLQLAPDSTKIKARKLLAKRTKYLKWQASLKEPMNWKAAISALCKGISVSKIWRIYRKTKRVTD